MNVSDSVRLYVGDQIVPNRVAEALTENGGEVFVVGGAVRDIAMNILPNDVDLLVRYLSHDRVSEILSSLDGGVSYSGADFGVFRFRNRHGAVEVALPRSDRSTGTGHRAFDIQEDPLLPIEKDLLRRDFTVNAMAVRLAGGGVVDVLGGIGDAKIRRLRVLTPTSLLDDPLRTMRGLVLAARFDYFPDRETLGRMRGAAEHVLDLPGERMHAELIKWFEAPRPEAAVRLARHADILRHVFPEVHQCFGFDQRNNHHELELGDHLIAVLDRIVPLSSDPLLRLAALLHDIGKPASQWIDPETGQGHYYEGRGSDGEPLGADHAEVGANLAYERLGRLRFPESHRRQIVGTISGHMFAEFTTKTGARRFLAKYGDLADDLITLRRADKGREDEDRSAEIERMESLIADVRLARDAVSKSDLAVSGRDVLAAGIPAGPKVGKILDSLLALVIEDPSKNDREGLLAEIEKMT